MIRIAKLYDKTPKLGEFFFDSSDPYQAAVRLTHQIARELETDRVDVTPLQRAPVELAYAVIAQGICVFRRDEATRVEYEANVLSRYGDYLPVLRALRRDILSGEDHERRIQRYREAFRRTERTLSEIKASQG